MRSIKYRGREWTIYDSVLDNYLVYLKSGDHWIMFSAHKNSPNVGLSAVTSYSKTNTPAHGRFISKLNNVPKWLMSYIDKNIESSDALNRAAKRGERID